MSQRSRKKQGVGVPVGFPFASCGPRGARGLMSQRQSHHDSSLGGDDSGSLDGPQQEMYLQCQSRTPFPTSLLQGWLNKDPNELPQSLHPPGDPKSRFLRGPF